jgi:heat shock protein HslJ
MSLRALIAAALVAAPASALAVETPRADGVWRLVRINGAHAPAQVTLRLTGGQIDGEAFCNSYSGRYQLRSGRLVADALGSTKRACADESLSRAETSYMAVLGARPRLKLGPHGLFLRAENGSTLQFRREPVQ